MGKDVSYIFRMKNEKKELEFKLNKLQNFLKENSGILMSCEKELMLGQEEIMKEYIGILEQRIGLSLTKEEVQI